MSSPLKTALYTVHNVSNAAVLLSTRKESLLHCSKGPIMVWHNGSRQAVTLDKFVVVFLQTFRQTAVPKKSVFEAANVKAMFALAPGMPHTISLTRYYHFACDAQTNNIPRCCAIGSPELPTALG